MSEKLSENKEIPEVLSVSQLSRKIKKKLSESFPESFWLNGEISEFRMHSSGHAYLELIEKDRDSTQVKSRIRATIWSYTFRMLRPYFEASTGYRIEAGIKVLVFASLEYHPQYGISVNITDIDPNYTIGDLARKKAEIIERLYREGIADMNKENPFPIVPQRIAIISSETAAGYGDFLDSLNNNQYHFHYELTLFPSIMQGSKAVGSIIHSLEQIYSKENFFDLVIIIRGGGATTDLECFNDYDLALNIAQFPLPVITGIGHERDDTICDLVAHTRMKTPTAVAEFLIDRTLDFMSRLEELKVSISGIARNEVLFRQQVLSNYSGRLRIRFSDILHLNRLSLNSSYFSLKNLSNQTISGNLNKLKNLSSLITMRSSGQFLVKNREVEDMKKELSNRLAGFLSVELERIKRMDNMVKILDPEHILKRGYSITYHEGKVLKSKKALRKGDIITTRLSDGLLNSEITKKN